MADKNYSPTTALKVDLGEKLRAVAIASATNVERLQQKQWDAMDREQAEAASREADKGSWVNGLGLEPTSTPANIVNTAASAVSGLSRTIGHAISTIPNQTAIELEAGMSDAKVQAFNRYNRGEASQADMALLNGADDSNVNEINPPSVLNRFQQIDAARAAGRKVNDMLDFTGIVNQENRNALKKSLNEAQGGLDTLTNGDAPVMDRAKALASILGTAGSAAVANPIAALEYIAENAPQIAIGGAGVRGATALAASNIGYASDTYNKGMENLAAEGKDMPLADERQAQLLKAGSLAAAEQVGEALQIAGVGKLFGPAATGKAGLRASLTNVLKETAKGAAGEAVTEGFQTYMEGQVENAPATAMDIYQGAVIGGLAGGGLTGAGRLAAEATKASAEKAEDVARVAAERVTFDAAVEAADPSVFLDRKAKTYNPANAVGVLMALSEKEDATPEAKQEYMAQATEIVERLEIQRNQLDPVKVQESLAEVEADIAATDPADTETVAMFTEERDELYAQLESLKDPKNATANKNRLTVLNKQIGDAQKTYEGLVRLNSPTATKAEVDTTLVEADSADVKVSSKAAQTLINLSMVAPDDLSADAAMKLATNTKNGLKPEQRDFLRQFSEARVAENLLKDLGKVSKEVLFGTDKNVGIAQYRTRIAAAMAANNQEGAQRQLALLGSFATDHAAKLAAVEAAPIPSQIIKKGDAWVVNTGKRLSDAALKVNGGVNKHANSGKLIEAITMESAALDATRDQLTSAVTLRFKDAPVQSTPSPAVTALPPNKSMKKSVEGGTRLNDKPVQTVVESPQTELNFEEDSKEVPVNTSPVSAASPSATSPVAVSADATTAPTTASAPAATTTKEAQPEATEQQASAPAESVAAEVATAEDKTENTDDILTPTGTLSVLASRVKALPTKLHEAFQDKAFNPVAQYLDQKPTSERYKSKRPLVEVKDFFSGVMARKVGIENYLAVAPFDNELEALRHFFSTAKKWIPALRENITEYSTDPKKFDFRFEDMMQFLVTKDGDTLTVDENVLTAMAYAGYNWAVKEAGAPRKTPEQLNAMHGRDNDALIDPEAFTMLKGVSNVEDTTIADIGGIAISALGLVPRKGAPKDILPRLQSAMGTHIMAMLESQGVLRRENINTATINSYFASNGVTYPPKANTTYVFANKEDLSAFKEANKGTKGVVDKLFGADAGPTIAASEPTKFVQPFAQHTQQEVSAVQAKAINDIQQIPHRVIPEMWSVLTGLGRDGVLRVAGKKNVETDNIHVRNIESVQAQNDNLDNQLDLSLEMLEADIGQDIDFDRPFYVTGEVWKQFRAGYTTQSLNQQTSKLHRYMFARPSWTSKVDLTVDAQKTELLVAIAAGLGLKTDEQPNAQTVRLLEAELAKPAMRAVADAMRAGLEKKDWANAQAIVDFAAGAEGMLTLQTLVALAKYEKAVEAGAKDVTVTMLVGADGKTNGPILTHLALGAASDVDGLMSMMERGGMYAAGSAQPTHFSEWRATGKQDLYQDLAAALLRNIQSSPAMDALQVITGKLADKAGQVQKAGRNLVKTPLTAFAFGSTLERSIEAMEDKFIESIYENIEKLAREDKPATDLINAVNLLLKMGNPSATQNNPALTAKELLSMALPKQDERALRAAFQLVMAEPVKATMESYFATFIQRRSDLNSTIQAGYAMYEAGFAAAKTKLINDLMEKGEHAYRIQTGGTVATGKGQKIPLHDLSIEQENALRKELAGLLPVAHTAYSLKSGKVSEGLYMAKQEASLSDDRLYQAKVTLKNPIKLGDNSMGNSIQAKGMTRVETNPGVAGTPYFMHSDDSANMHDAMNEVSESMNVHDEIGNSVLKIGAAAGAINKATYENLLAFSPAREALGMLERQAQALAAGVKDGSITQATVAQVFADWAAIVKKRTKIKYTPTAQQAADSVIGMAVENAVQADTLRLGALARMGSVDQYTWEGGQFVVDGTMRDKAQDALKNMVKDAAPETKKAIAELLAFMKTEALPAPTPVAETPDPVPTVESTKQLGVTGAALATIANASVTPESINEMAPAKRAEKIEQIARAAVATSGTGMTAWGQLGKPENLNEAIRDAFDKQPKMDRAQVVALLAKNLTGASRALLDQVAAVLPENLTVNLVTPETSADAVLDKPHSKSRGWYVATNTGENAIYVLSDAFVHTGLNAETLLHELVHGALAREVESPSSKAAKSLIVDLEDLLYAVKQEPGAGKFADATANIQEFLAWGLSNKPFQAFLNGVQYEDSHTTRNRLVTAMKAFMKTITGLLFKQPNEAKQRALYVLIQNAAGLFAAAAENKAEAADINLSHAVPPNDYTTADIYEALASTSNPLTEKDDARLRSLMLKMVEKLSPIYGVFGKDAMTNQTLSAASVFATAAMGGTAPFASSSIAAGFGGNDQVAFMLEQVEVTVRAAMDGSDGQTSVAYRELSKLYDEARTKLQGKLPQAQYDFIFKMEAGNDNRSDYLSRFAALGLVNPEVNALLDFRTDTATPVNSAMSFTERLQAVFENILEWVVGKWTATHAGQKADAKLDALAAQLVMIEAKRRARLNVQRSQAVENIEEVFRGMAEGARDKIDEWAQSPMFRNSGNGFVKAASSITSVVVKDRLDELFLAYQTFSDTHFHHSNGMFSGLVNELRGSNAANVVFYKLLRMTKFLEGQRKDLITNTARVVLASFANKGKDLTDKQKKAVSAVFLRTDMATLLENFGIEGIRGLLSDKAKMAKALADTEQALAGNRHQLFYLNAAEALGYQMATGDAGIEHTLLNAHAIARLMGTGKESQVRDEDVAKVEPLIDTLASLYALQHSEASLIDAALEVFDAEAGRTDKGNGVELVLRMHQQLQKESRERLFVGQEALMMKGYLPEVYNPYIEVVTAESTQKGAMEQQGYGKGMLLEKDDADLSADRMLFARHGSGLLPYLTGTLSMTATKTKGSRQHNGNTDLFSVQGQYNSDMMARIKALKQGEVDALFKRRVNPAKAKKTYLVPVLNPSGQVVNYRYMMKNHTKDDVLQRDNRFDSLLGAMAGSIYDKQSAPKQNRTVVEALKAQYDEEFKRRAPSYIEVGPRSPDPEMREIYRLMPEATKQAIREVWKSDSMYVRIDLLDINFGYRKKSLSDVFNEDRDAREGMAKFTAEFLGFFLGGGALPVNATEQDADTREAKATLRIRNIEEIWQTFVKEAKDILVVKSVSTLFGNVMSNFSLLYAYGVPVTDMIRSHRIALRGAVAYKKDSETLFDLQTKLDTGTSGNADETKKKIVQLKDALARNPVRSLIEAGLMPTIVEDVEIDDDIYSFKSRQVKRLEAITSKINPHVLNVGKNLYMTHDTKLYKALSQGAQLSDFLARYTLHEHMTTRKRDPMTNDEAVQLASDAFINYDVPTHRNMQYLNDMGFLRFTKYYLRIQKVILHLYRDNPGRMLGLMMMSNYFTTMPTVLDSAAIARFGNPLESGALEFPASLDDLTTVKWLQAPFK